MKRYIKSSVEPGEGWWFLCRHGIGPGTIPNDCHVLQVVDHPTNPWKCYVELDRFLTTKELQEYDLKEEIPESVTGSTKVVASNKDSIKKYYREISDRDLEALTNYPGDEYIVEEVPGYNMKHIAWYIAKDQYQDQLSDQGIDLVELVEEEGNPERFYAYVVHDRVYPLGLEEVERALSDELYD